MNYFFDSYAIIEMINNNPKYFQYREELVNTTTLNVSEVYYFLLRTHNKQTADYWIRNLNFNLIKTIKLEISLEVAQFRFRFKKKHMSYVDCLGYLLAKKLGLKFLTGDKEFKNMKNVEFVK